MFDVQRSDEAHVVTPLSTVEIQGWILRLLEVGGDLGGDARIEQIAASEAVKGALAAAQVALTVDLYDAQRAADCGRGLKQADTARSVSGEIGLARRESPRRGSRHLALAQALTDDLPLTFAALQRSEISERRAAMVARETSCTSSPVRGQVDRQIESDLASESDSRAHALVVGATAELDATAVAARRVRAVGARRVSVRPVPDGMAVLTAVVPCADAMAAITALRRGAGERLDDGTGRSLGQATADLLVKRLTGRDPRDGFDVQINLVMDADTLFRRSLDTGDVRGLRAHPSRPGPPSRRRRCDGRRPRGHQTADSPTVHRAERGRAGADGVGRPPVHRPAAAVDCHPGPDLPHAVLRCPDPPDRPRHGARSRRRDVIRERAGSVCDL